MKIRWTAVVLAALLGGCSFTRTYPEQTRHFAIEPVAAAAPATRRDGTLRVGAVRVSASFAGNELVYRFDDVRFTGDFYNRFIAPPSAMLATRMAEWLDRSGPFLFVAQPGAATATDYVLEAVFTDLYGDFRPGRAPAAVMHVQVVVLDAAGGEPKAVYARAFERRVDLGEPTPDAVARGYGVALGQILTEVAADLGRLPVR